MQKSVPLWNCVTVTNSQCFVHGTLWNCQFSSFPLRFQNSWIWFSHCSKLAVYHHKIVYFFNFVQTLILTKFKKKFSAICFTPGLKIFLVLSFFHSNKHHFCTCALFESFVVTVTPQWCAQGNWPTVNSLGIWVVDPARYAACWPLNFRMMCRISPILTSHCSKTVRWIMLHPYAAFLDQGS